MRASLTSPRAGLSYAFQGFRMTEAPRFLRPVTAPSGDVGMAVTFETPRPLDWGRKLAPFTVAYITYGKLNAAKSNAVLICHALTMDQFVASDNPITGKPGWWTPMVGPGTPIDTDRFFVICANVIGGCMGSTGPADIDPATGKPFGLNFPLVTVRDMVSAQTRLIEHLCIEKLLSVIGGCMGCRPGAPMAAPYPELGRPPVTIFWGAGRSSPK